MSYFHQASDVPFTADTIPSLFDKHATKTPSKDALVIYDSAGERNALSFKDLQEKSINLAALLLENGFGCGGRVLVMLPNSQEFLIASMALCRVGANAIFVTFGCTAENMAEYIRRYENIKLVIHAAVGAVFWERVKVAFGKDISAESVVCIGEGILPGTLSGQEILKERKELNVDAVKAVQSQIQPDDPAFIFMTSGSTGAPKSVQQTHFSLINSKLLATSILSINEESVMFNNRPMGWIGGFQPGIMFVYCLGATLVSTCGITVQQPHIEQLCGIMEKEKCTHAMALFYMLYDLVHFDKLAEYDLSSLKYVMSGGQINSEEIFYAFMQKLPDTTVLHLYGSSEAQVYTGYKIIDPSQQGSPSEFGVLTPFPHIEVKIVDENDRIVAMNEPGELCLRGPGILEVGYDSEMTNQKETPGRWFHTDDSAVMIEKGKFQMLGRIHDTFKTACFKVHPAPIEKILMKHPAVQQVVVVGVPDERMYMEICACVIVSSGQELNVEEMAAWCDTNFDIYEEGISRKPRYFVAIENFPVTSNGKTDRRRVKEMAIKQLGLS